MEGKEQEGEYRCSRRIRVGDRGRRRSSISRDSSRCISEEDGEVVQGV